MTISRGIRATTILSLLAFTAACGQQAGSGSDTASDGSHTGSLAADVAVLRVDHIGGFVSPYTQATQLPTVTIYADGRVFSQGPQVAIYPGPALPNLLIRHISVKDVDKLVTRALDAGLGSKVDLGTPQIADAPSTRFTMTTEDGTKTLEVVALSETTDEQPGLTQQQRKARTALGNLLSALTDLPGALGADAVTKEEPYVATAVAAIALPWTAGDPQITRPEVAWPGPKLPGESLGAGLNLNCVDATGDTAARILAAAAKASAITPWTSGGSRWTVGLRPLLPGESGCAALRTTN
jgi:hypothetical protein